MIKTILSLISFLFSISPFVLLAIYYDKIPSLIPVFVDWKGHPTVLTDKSVFSVFRLPLMGIMVQIICFVMRSVRLDHQKEKHQFLWLSASLLAAMKMSLTSLEVLIYTNTTLLNLLRTVVLAIIGWAVVSIMYLLYALCKSYRQQFASIFSRVTNLQRTFLFLSFAGYIILVLFPLTH